MSEIHNIKEKYSKELTKNKNDIIEHILPENRTVDLFAEFILSIYKPQESTREDYVYSINFLHTFFSDDVCVEFMKKYPGLRYYIPEDRLIKIIEKNIKILDEHPYIIQHVNKCNHTQEMVEIILEKKDKSLLQYINLNLINAKCLNKYPLLVEYLPEIKLVNIIKENIEVLKNYPYIIKCVDKRDQTQEMVDIILKIDACNLRFVDPRFIDVNLLKKYPHAIKHIPKDNQTKEMVDFIIMSNYKNLFKYLNLKFIGTDYFEKFPNLISRVPFKEQTSEMATAAFSANNNIVQRIAPRLRTDEMKKYSMELFQKSNNLNDLRGTIMTGKEFNGLVKGYVFIKILRTDEIHNGLHLKEGLNKDPVRFDPDCECCAGGIYFIDVKKRSLWENMGLHNREVTIPDDAVVKVEMNKIKATKIILGKEKFLLPPKL